MQVFIALQDIDLVALLRGQFRLFLLLLCHERHEVLVDTINRTALLLVEIGVAVLHALVLVIDNRRLVGGPEEELAIVVALAHALDTLSVVSDLFLAQCLVIVAQHHLFQLHRLDRLLRPHPFLIRRAPVDLFV